MTSSYSPPVPPRYQLQYTNAGLDSTRAWALFRVPPGESAPRLWTTQEQPGHSAHQVQGAQQWATSEINQHLADEGAPYQVADGFIKDWMQTGPGVFVPYLNHISWTARLITAAGVFTFTQLTQSELSKVKGAVLHGEGRIELDGERLALRPRELEGMKDEGAQEMFLLARHVVAETYKRVTTLVNPHTD